MDQLPRLNARLATLSELRDIVRALRAMAASAAREGEAALPAVQRYSEVIDAAVGDGLDLAAEYVGKKSELRAGEATRIVCVIGAEHGFVGGLNQRLMLEARRPAGAGLFIVGHRAASVAAELGLPTDGVLPMTSHVRGIPLLARQITERISAAQEVDVAFCRYRPESTLSVVERQIIPVLHTESRRDRPNLPLHHSPPLELLRALAGEYLMAEISRALTESFVAENATRLRILTNADRNIDQKMDALRQEARRLRQQAITAELLDIVIGAEASEFGR